MQDLIIINSMLFLVFFCSVLGAILWRWFVKKKGGEDEPTDNDSDK
jgi:hypothetical protein